MNEPQQPSFDDWLLAKGIFDASALTESNRKWLLERYEAEMKAKHQGPWDLKAAAQDCIRLTCANVQDFTLEAAADGADPKKLRKYSMTAYTGAAMDVGWGPPVVVDLAGVSVDSQRIPNFLGHNQERIVGHSESIEVSPQRIYASGIISGVGEASQEMLALASNGFPWRASIGASVQKREFIDKGESALVNGRRFQGPVIIARKSSLYEISFVPIGADNNTSATVAAGHTGGSNVNFSDWLKAEGWDESTLSDKQKTTLQAAWKASQNPTPAPVPVAVPVVDDSAARLAKLRAAEAQEYARMDRIRAMAKEFGDVEMEIEVAGVKKKVGIAAHAIECGMNETDTELAFRRNARPKGNHTAFGHLVGSGGASGSDVTAEALEASLCLQAGIPEARVAKWFNEKTMNQANSKEMRAANITTINHEMCQRAGVHVRPGRANDDSIRAGMQVERRLRAEGHLQAAGFSTISLSGILGNTANKMMVASYEAQEVVWPNFCAIRNHNDFKIHTRYRLDSTGSFRKVAPDGELEHIGLDEASYTNRVHTYGAIISLTRQMQINDDLGAFAEIPMAIGRMAAIRQEEAFFVLLLSNPSSFFGSGNNNLISGGTGAMTAANGLAAITLAETKYSNQVDTNSKPILVPPDRMLLGTVNYVPARNIYEGKLKISGSDSTQVADNEHAGKYTPYKSPYMNNTLITDQDGAAISGQSSTLWLLFADPARLAAFAMAFLNGQRTPTIESSEVEFTMLGMQWRGYSDFGAGVENPYGAVEVAGA